MHHGHQITTYNQKPCYLEIFLLARKISIEVDALNVIIKAIHRYFFRVVKLMTQLHAISEFSVSSHKTILHH